MGRCTVLVDAFFLAETPAGSTPKVRNAWNGGLDACGATPLPVSKPCPALRRFKEDLFQTNAAVAVIFLRLAPCLPGSPEYHRLLQKPRMESGCLRWDDPGSSPSASRDKGSSQLLHRYKTAVIIIHLDAAAL